MNISQQVGIKGPKTASGEIGKQLKTEEIDTLFSDEQLLQLFDLYKASTGLPELETDNTKTMT